VENTVIAPVLKTSRVKQVKVSVPADIAENFKQACAKANVSMANQLSTYMADYSESAKVKKPTPDYTTKRRRRAAIQSIIEQLGQIKDFEERYRDNIPENLKNSIIYDTADEHVSWLEEAIEALGSI